MVLLVIIPETTMTDLNTIHTIFGWFLKTGFLLLTLIFLGFAVLFIRQVDMMTSAVQDPLNPKLKIVSWLYLLLTILIFVFFILYL